MFFIYFFFTSVTNLIQMIFKYELQFCGIHMAESLLVGRNFMSGICKLKPEKNFLKTFKTLKTLKPKNLKNVRKARFLPALSVRCSCS